MAAESYKESLDEVLAHEGGFVNHPKDPGGATNRGITKATLEAERGRPVTIEDVRDLTLEEASGIYRRRYWDAVRGDDLPAGVDLATFDAAVNSGVSRGARWLQTALGQLLRGTAVFGIAVDGKIGRQTLEAARAADPVQTVSRICAIRMGFLRGLSTFSTFGRGWSRRVARVEAVGVRMAAEARDGKARPVLLEQKAQASVSAVANQRAAVTSAGGSVGGGAVAWDQLPVWAAVGIAALLLVVAINFIGRRRHEKARAEAFQRAAEEAKP